jgi:hypothetical protein
MIPLPMLSAIPWRLIGAAALVAAFALMGWRVSVWHEAYGELGTAQARLALEESCGEGSKCQARELAAREEVERESKQIVDGLEAELAAIRGRPPRVVRVCPGAGDVPIPRTAVAGHGTAAGAGVVSGQIGRDIGPDLYGLAREADEIVARCRGLQEWNRALSAE